MMKVARYHLAQEPGMRGEMRVEEIAADAPAADEVRVRVGYAGICGSDLARYRQLPTSPASLRALLGDISPIPGHEISGTVEAAGANVPATWDDGTPVIGARVVVHPQVACGECAQCRAGYWTGCARQGMIQLIGLHRDGGFAQSVVAPFDHLVRVPDGLSLRAAALAEPLAVAIHSIELLGALDADLPIAVIGDGSIGLLTAHVLERRGQRNVTLVGRHTERMGIARALGILHLLDEAQAAATPAEAYPVVFHTAGSQSALELAFHMAGRGGRIVTVGYLHGDDAGVNVPLFYQLIRREKALMGACGSSLRDMQEAVRMLADGTIDAESLISATIPLDAIVAEGFEALVGDQKAPGKILVQPD